ncbi:MAG: MaoC family dehydratase N-terminal domain-containing protein [Paracoccaceae bacterium]
MAETHENWIGRTTARGDTLTPRLVAEFRATLAGLVEDRPVPLGVFWALNPEIVAPELLGRDGHPRMGLYIPSLPLPRRMWAGGELHFAADISAGAMVTRETTVENVATKEGASGKLGFVTLRNRHIADGAVVVEERQNIVYRTDHVPGSAASVPPSAPDLGAPLAETAFTSTPTLLFRYSALTFNGHRIHYDAAYATGVEGYAGLVVHGPMQAIVLMNLAARVFGRTPSRFTYRGVAPHICGQPARAEAFPGEGGGLSLRMRIDGGPVTMTATAEGVPQPGTSSQRP